MWWHRRGRRRALGEMSGPVEGLADARRAVAAGERALAATRRRTPEIRALGQLLRELRQENHFAERVEQMLSRPDTNGGVHGG